MHIQNLYVYPLKSVRPIALGSTSINALGPLHDRVFLLQHERPPAESEDGLTYRNMHIAHYPQLCLFIPELLSSGSEILIRHNPPQPGKPREFVVPLAPETSNLAQREIVMHKSACTGYDMGDTYAAFFTSCLGFNTRLVYLGSSRRPILGSVVPGASPRLDPPPKAEITFADCAPLLITTRASVDALSERIAGNEEVDVTKLRPNVVIAADGDDELQPWEEDFWGEIEIAGHSVVLTANCARCCSINVGFGFVPSRGLVY